MLFGGSCVIGPNLHPVFANKKLEQDLNPKEAMPSRQLSMSNALFIIFYVTYAMQIMSATQPDTCEHKNSAIRKHFHEQYGRSDLLNKSHFKILKKVQRQIWFLRVNCLKCYTSRNSNLIWTSKRTPYVQSFCLTCNVCNYCHHLLFVLAFMEPVVFIHLWLDNAGYSNVETLSIFNGLSRFFYSQMFFKVTSFS